MEKLRNHLRRVSFFMALFFAIGPGTSAISTAAMVSTGDMVAVQETQMDRQHLMQMLDRPEVKDKLADLGVDEEQVRERIQNLTPQELAQFDQQLADAPAGQDVVSALVLIFVVLIVTDMLCATNVFSFVNCIQ